MTLHLVVMSLEINAVLSLLISKLDICMVHLQNAAGLTSEIEHIFLFPCDIKYSVP